MIKRKYMPLKPKEYLKNNTRALVLSTGILAGIVALSGFTKAVDAEELNLDQEELQELYELYTQIEMTEHKATDVENTSVEQVSELTEEQKEELDFIRTQLIKMIELAGGQSMLDQLHNHSLSYEQLDTIFNALLENKLTEEADETVKEGTTTAVEETVEEGTTAAVEETVEEGTTAAVVETVEEKTTEAVKATLEPVVTEEALEEPAETETVQVETAVLDANEESTESDEKEAVAADQTETEAEKETVTDAESLVYVVRSGDTLGTIAQRYQTTVNKLASLNNITNINRLSVGQVLAINEAGKEEAKAPQPTKPEDLNKVTSPSDFIENLAGYAQNVASGNNLYASVMIAQASLESGYGKSSLSAPPNHNLFGIKGSYNGESVAKRTQEYYASTGWITITDQFKKYPNYEKSLQDNANLLRNGLRSNSAFYSGTWAEKTMSYHDATLWLQGRYATDPTYASKLNRIIEQFNLTRFDIVEIRSNSTVNAKPVVPETPTTPPASPYEKVTTYKIVSGDTLNKIAKAFNTTVQDLKAANKLTGDLIFVNQEIAVPFFETETKPEKVTDSVEVKPETPEEDPTDSTPEEKTSENDYTVVRGDTLSQIAGRFDITVSQLKTLNKLTGDTIYINQKLIVPIIEEAQKDVQPVEDDKQSEQVKNATSVTVILGDTLSQIAKKHDTTVKAITETNKLTSDRIYVGQRLTLPQTVTTAPSKVEEKQEESKPEVAIPSAKENQTTHTVKAGDTLGQLANRFNTTVTQLKELNKLTSDLIRVNQKLTVPDNQVAESKPVLSKPEEKPVKEDKKGTTDVSVYTVESGDTLSQIAKRFDTTVAKLKSVNKLNTDLIFVGRKLSVNGSTQVKEKPKEQKPVVETKPAVGQTVTIKAGDSLSKVAREHNVSVAELQEWNGIENANRIFVGQTLKVVKNDSIKKETSESIKPKDTTVSPSVSEKKSDVTYTVKSGDTLSYIARDYNVTISQLKQWNKLTSDIIFINQKLTVEETTVKAAASKTETPEVSKPVAAVNPYTVKAGDTLSHIAKEFKVTVREIKALNNLNSDLIFVNQPLTVST